MNTIPELPKSVDLFSIFILLGVIQGLLLALFLFFKKERTAVVSNRLLGLILLGMASINLEIFLCYSRYITKLIHLVDFSEPFNLCLAPAFYLFVNYKISPSDKINWKQMYHFLPFVIYILYSLLFFVQSPEYKFNAFLSAYFPEKNHIPCVQVINPDPIFLKRFINELMGVQAFLYLGLIGFVIYKAFKRENFSLFSNTNKILSRLRNATLFVLIYLIFLLCVKMTFKEDLGDHFLAVFLSIIIYSISFVMVTKPSFFSENVFSQIKKYGKSSLTSEMKDQILETLIHVMKKEKPFLNSAFSLTELAKQIRTTPHHLSQVLNDCLKKNFYEFTAEYRIGEAQKILSDPQLDNIMMEEIAERVGYNSKSAFNTAFKKQTGFTPSQFREQNKK